jgi:hypothetical protein
LNKDWDADVRAFDEVYEHIDLPGDGMHWSLTDPTAFVGPSKDAFRCRHPLAAGICFFGQAG